MKTYKVDYDKATQMIKIRWFDEEGNEVAGDAGTYRITIPANTFYWHGDGVNCDGVTGNEEFVYTLVLAGSAPKPIITPQMKDSNIYFIIDNSANSNNYNTLGYKTYDARDDYSILFNKPVKVEIVAYDPNFNASRFGYDEKKAMVYVGIDSNTPVEPDFEYSCTLVADSVYNQGLGSPYDDTPIYNDDTTFYFTGVTKPSVAITGLSFNFDNNKVTVKYKVSNDNLNELRDVHFDSMIDNSVKPYIINSDNSATAYCESITQGANKEDIDCVFAIKNLDAFVSTATGQRTISINVQTLRGWIKNFGDGINTVGYTESDASAKRGTIPYMSGVNKPRVQSTQMKPNFLTANWVEVFGTDYVTTQNGPSKFYATMKDGRKVDISQYNTVQTVGKDVTVNYDTTTNFGLDPEQVSTITVEFPEGYFTNQGDNKMTTGTAKSDTVVYNFEPVDCKPKINAIKTNVNPLYPIIDGNKLEPVHDGETSVYNANSVVITDMSNNVLMKWDPSFVFKPISLAEKTEVNLNESLTSETVGNYSADDEKLFSMEQMYSKDNNYELYHGNQIKLKVVPSQFGVQGDGFKRLGQLTGETDTPEITKYVLELETSTSFQKYQHSDEGGRMNTQNPRGGFMDWNASAFKRPDEMMTYQGSLSWGAFNGGDAYATYVNCGSNNDYIGFGPFCDYGMKQLWSKALYEQTDNEYLKNTLYWTAFEDEPQCSEKLYYEELKEWFSQIWLPKHPITFTGETGEEMYPEKYTDAFGWDYSFDREVKLEYFKEWMKHFEDTHINHFFSMYNVSSTTDNTYSFLYDTPASTWKFGLPDKPYNETAFEFGSVIYRLLKIDTSNQSNFDYFLNNQSFLHDIPAKLDLSKAKTTNYMFNNCYEDNEWNKGFWWNGHLNSNDTLENVTSANYMYGNDVCITAINETFSFKSLISANGMFVNCNSLSKLPAVFNPTELEYANDMLSVSREGLTGGVMYCDTKGEFVVATKDLTVYPYYDTVTKELTKVATNTTIDVLPQSAFNLTVIAPTWKSVSKVKEAIRMFQRRKITSIPNQWNFSSLYDSTEMFAQCDKFTKIPDSWVDTDALLVADNMFDGCVSLTGLHDGFKCKNLIHARGMFSNCEFSRINDTFQPNQVEDINAMFWNCPNFSKIPTAWTSITNVQTSVSAFKMCPKLTELPASWTDCNSTNATSMFEDSGIKEVNINFPNLKFINNMFTGSKCSASTGVLNIGAYYRSESIGQGVFANKQFIFKVEDFGKTENLRTQTSSIAGDAVTLSLQSIGVPETDDEMDKFTDSILYLLDHVWTGETVINEDSVGSRKDRTRNRSEKSKDAVCLYFTQAQLDAIEPMMVAKAPSHNEFTQKLVHERWKGGGGSYAPTTNYSLLAHV